MKKESKAIRWVMVKGVKTYPIGFFGGQTKSAINYFKLQDKYKCK